MLSNGEFTRWANGVFCGTQMKLRLKEACVDSVAALVNDDNGTSYLVEARLSDHLGSSTLKMHLEWNGHAWGHADGYNLFSVSCAIENILIDEANNYVCPIQPYDPFDL